MTNAGSFLNPGLMLKIRVLHSAGDDGCKNKPVGEDDSVGGINLMKDYSAGNTLWEEIFC